MPNHLGFKLQMLHILRFVGFVKDSQKLGESFMVRVDDFTSSLRIWNREIFGNIKKESKLSWLVLKASKWFYSVAHILILNI